MNTINVSSLCERVKQLQRTSINEAMTKTSLILPFIQALGYDIFNPMEVAAEYTSDYGTKKGEKIDFAILRDGEAIILIECKPLGDCLDTGKCSQLFRYFSMHPARIGILTDGCRYLFFTDLDKQNLMDTTPFMEIDFSKFNERMLPELQKLSKDAWDVEGIVSSAEKMKYVGIISKAFSEDILDPSEEFIRFYASLCYEGKMTANIRSQFKPIVKKAVTEAINDQINKRLAAARATDDTEHHQQAETKEHNLPPEPSTGKEGIVTHNTEVWALVAIRTMAKDVVDQRRITMRDQKTYCNILFDENNRKPICRLYNFEHFDWGDPNIGDRASVVIFNTKNGERFPLQYIDDLYPLQDKIIEAIKQYI